MRSEQPSQGPSVYDPIEQELDELLSRFATDTADERQAREDARMQRLMDVREKFRAGELPDHFKSCRTCGRAILLLNHVLACRDGKSFINIIKP